MNNLGYDVFEANGQLEIQTDDDVIHGYQNDRDATIACLNDAINGNMQSAEMIKSVLLQEKVA